MEALLFTLDSVAIVLMVFMGLRDDRRAPGTPATSIFRMRDTASPPQSDAAAPDDWAGWDTESQP